MTEKLHTVSQGSLTEQLRAPALSADHAMGLELQIVELVERQTRARVQHRLEDAEQFEADLAQLRAELVATVDVGLADA